MYDIIYLFKKVKPKYESFGSTFSKGGSKGGFSS